MKFNLKMITEQFVKLDEKIAKLDEDTFDRLSSDSINLGNRIEALKKELREVEKALYVPPTDEFDRGRITAIREVLGEES